MPTLNQYPLDPSGVSVNNLVQGEAGSLATGLRVLALKNGAFFAASLKIKDVATNQFLTAAQFHAAWRYSVPTAQFKKDVCGLVVITDPTVGNSLLIDYQVVGGPYSTSEQEVVDLLTRRIPQARPAAWPTLLAAPPALTPADFTDDAFGFARVENVLNAVARTMAGGDPLAQDAVFKYTDDTILPYLDTAPTAFVDALAAHLTAADPHPYYLKKSELPALLPTAFPAVRRPSNVLPVNNAQAVALKPALEGIPYRALYGIPQAKLRVQISIKRDFSTLVLDQTIATPGVRYQTVTNLITKTKYYWRLAYQNTETEWSPWSLPTAFTTV
jgi:hypothetical protein